MSESHNLPQAISHKKLSLLLNNAQKDKLLKSYNRDKYVDQGDELLEDITDWELSTKALLKKLTTKNENFLKDKSPNSIMALGAMEVHLNMALQALQAFKKDKN